VVFAITIVIAIAMSATPNAGAAKRSKWR